jgi:hypothetical protein
MALWSFNVATFLPVAVADTTAYTNQGYMAIEGGSSTQMINIEEVYIGGQASSGSVTNMVLARDSTVCGTSNAALVANEKNAALHPSTAALAAPQICFTQSSTKPQRSSTLGIAALPLNAFGGEVLWRPPRPGALAVLGNTASLGEISLSCYTGGTPGNVGAHIMYEPL